MKPSADFCLLARLPRRVHFDKVVSGTGSLCWHSEAEKEVYRARHMLPSTGMTKGQALEDLALWGQDL